MLNRSFTILDGGMGQELVKRAQHKLTPLWSGDVLRDHPDLVVDVHRDFIKAGADVITLSSYAATPTRLAKYNRQEEFKVLQEAAINAARQACNDMEQSPLIAGTLPPLPGSYRPSERLTSQSSQEEYQQIAEQQYKHVDLFLCETMASIEEACISTAVAMKSGLPVWTSFTVNETNGSFLRSGELIIEAAKAVLAEGASALLINCSPPEATSKALVELAPHSGTFGAYANGFITVEPYQGHATVDVLKSREEINPQTYAEFGKEWLSMGATILGGCCEIGPEHIAEIYNLREKILSSNTIQNHQ
ncbi:MAG: homocysteine S-methyltransferase family protein [SAR324 cluster bacterium]|nr:homocysteine S-methyltransferase family protein [SAR324 cluster bacterium]